MTTKLDIVRHLAGKADFFQAHNETRLRIEFSDEPDHFECVDEDNFVNYEIRYDEVDLDLDKFYAITEMAVPDTLPDQSLVKPMFDGQTGNT